MKSLVVALITPHGQPAGRSRHAGGPPLEGEAPGERELVTTATASALSFVSRRHGGSVAGGFAAGRSRDLGGVAQEFPAAGYRKP